MRRGEPIISALLAALVFFAVLAIQRDWQFSGLEDAASSAEEFILTTTGMGGGAPSIRGYAAGGPVVAAFLSPRIGALFPVLYACTSRRILAG